MSKNSGARRRGRPRFEQGSLRWQLEALERAETAGLDRKGQALLLEELHVPAAERDRAIADAKKRATKNAGDRLLAARAGKTVYGLRLTLGGAPHTPHYVKGLSGTYRPDRATGVGGLGEPTYEQASAAAAEPGCPVELLALSVDQCEKAFAALTNMTAEEFNAQCPELVAEALARKLHKMEAAGPVRRLRRLAARSRKLAAAKAAELKTHL